MKSNLFLCFIATTIFLGSCKFKNQTDSSSNIPVIDTANFDHSVKASDDFYQYVNGKWLKKNPVPASEARWDNFSFIHNQNLQNLRLLLEDAAQHADASNLIKQKVGDFYAMAMDSVKLNKDGISPLNEELNRINSFSDKKSFASLLAHLHQIGVRTFFEFSVGADSKASTENIVSLGQANLGLPDKDYFINPDPSLETIRQQYKLHLKNMFVLMGEQPEKAVEIGNNIFEFEKELAKNSMNRVQLRNIESQYNKKTLNEFVTTCSNFDWMTYFKTIGIESKIQHLIVAQPVYFNGLNDLTLSTKPETIKNYLRWCLICSFADKLSDNFGSENFSFYGTALNGSPKQKPRWKRAVQQTDGDLSDLLGQLYVEKYFSAEAKQKVNAMVDNLIAAYKDRIQTRDWMSAETKKQANHKLSTIMRKLGYPDKWRDCSKLEVKRDAYVLNCCRANTFEFNYMVDKLGKPVDKTEWGMTPPTVNAYYNPSYNEIVFPAGIMQIPFFNANADDAVNYGAMGAIIGHELTHGFDDQGCQYDADGNLKNWWTKEDSLHFNEKTNKIVNQFNHFAALDTFHINGNLTLGENIADLGGLTIAYYAYKKSLEGKPLPEKIDGFTGEQRFFISWAQGWRGNLRPEYLKQLIKTNPHSPNKARVICPLSNMKEFYDAFEVKEGDKMYMAEKDRTVIW